MFSDTHGVRLDQGDFSCFGVSLNDVVDNPNVAPGLAPGVLKTGRPAQGRTLHPEYLLSGIPRRRGVVGRDHPEMRHISQASPTRLTRPTGLTGTPVVE